MKCSNCGKELEGKFEFCPSCGKPPGTGKTKKKMGLGKTILLITFGLFILSMIPSIMKGMKEEASRSSAQVVSPQASSSQTPKVSPEKRAEFDRQVAQHWIKYGGGMIVKSEVNSSNLDKGIPIVDVKLYFNEIPNDFRQALEYICENIHGIYKSGVNIVAYKITDTGDARRMATSEWSVFNNSVKTKIF